MSRGSILFVDDEAEVRDSARDWLVLSGFDVETAANAGIALSKLDGAHFDLVITDVRMPDMDGLELLRAVRLRSPQQALVLLTGHGDVNLAVEAMKAGAHDFLEKPYDANHLLVVADRAIATSRLKEEVARLRSSDNAARNLESRLVGATPAMVALRARMLQIADFDVDVLIQGETGTGKEVVARAMHDFSKRRGQPFVALNCAAIPESVFESEIFGYDRGAFTGALQKRVGKIEFATGGTVFFDEIESMPLGLQAKLLRVIQERVVEPLGSNRQIPVDVRFVAATKVDLGAKDKSLEFRPDLYFRLSTVGLSIPRLRDRRADIPLLFCHFYADAAARHRLTVAHPSASLLATLSDRDWPGNVRELKAAAERYALGLPLFDISSSDAGDGKTPLTERVAKFEALLIREALDASQGNSQVASSLLGVPLRTLNEKIQRHGLRARRD